MEVIIVADVRKAGDILCLSLTRRGTQSGQGHLCGFGIGGGCHLPGGVDELDVLAGVARQPRYIQPHPSTSWSASSTITFCAFRREDVSIEAVRVLCNSAIQMTPPTSRATATTATAAAVDRLRKPQLARRRRARPDGVRGRELVHASRMRHPWSPDNRRRRLFRRTVQRMPLSVLSGALRHSWTKTKSRTGYRPHSLLNQCAAGHFVRFDAKLPAPTRRTRRVRTDEHQDSALRTAASP